jgi:predicted nucleic acid-binding protein
MAGAAGPHGRSGNRPRQPDVGAAVVAGPQDDRARPETWPLVVLDTNISMASCFAPTSASARIVDEWRAGRFGLVMSSALRGELAHLVGRLGTIRALRRQADCLAALLDDLETWAEWAEPAPLTITLSDRADELVLGTAVGGGATFLVSNDAVLLAADGYGRVRILRPGAFIDALDGLPPVEVPS